MGPLSFVDPRPSGVEQRVAQRPLEQTTDRPAAGSMPLADEAGRGRDWRGVASKVAFFVAAIFLFILAIQLMKKGAQAIGPRIEGTFPFDNGISTLGLGWMGAYFVLSGSPVAATALAFYSGGSLTE